MLYYNLIDDSEDIDVNKRRTSKYCIIRGFFLNLLSTDPTTTDLLTTDPRTTNQSTYRHNNQRPTK